MTSTEGQLITDLLEFAREVKGYINPGFGRSVSDSEKVKRLRETAERLVERGDQWSGQGKLFEWQDSA